MSAAELLRGPLRIEANPFMLGTAGLRIGRPLQGAFSEILRQVELQAPLVLVTGGAGTGKTLLSDMTARACSEMGLSVRCVDRGDMVLGERSDLLLVDEADSVPDSFLEALSVEGGKSAATTIVFLGLPACTRRFVSLGVHPVVVELTPLPPPDARIYLLETATSAGFPDLFTAEALDLIIYESHGTPRLLRSMASFAFFVSASGGASQIGLRHVGHAGAAQVPLGGGKIRQSTERIFCGIETPVEDQRNGHPPLGAEDEDESTQRLPCGVETPVEGQRDADLPSGAQDVDESTQQVPCIEEGHFEALPGRVYAIGYGRSYAAYLGPDAEKFADRLKAEIAARGGAKDPAIDLLPSAERKLPQGGRVIAGLLLVALVYSGYHVFASAGRTFEQPVIPVPARLAAEAGLTQKPVAEPPLPPVQQQAPVLPPEPMLPLPTEITVTPPVSVPAELAPRLQAPLPPGRRYGVRNRNSRITLRVHRPTRVAVQGTRNRTFIDRTLAAGDTYRVPNMVGLRLTAPDAGAVEVILDGSSVGFAGEDGVVARRLSLNPQNIIDRQQRG